MPKRQIRVLPILCLFIAIIGGIYIASIEEPQSGVIDFPIPEVDAIGIYYNPNGKLSWEQIQTPQSQKYFLPFDDEPFIAENNQDSASVWVRIPLENTSSETQSYCMEVKCRYIDFARLYSPQKDGNYTIMQAGEGISYAERTIQSLKPFFYITLEPHSQAVYFLFLEEPHEAFIPLMKLWDSIENFNRILVTENRHISFHFGLYYSIFLFSSIAYLVIRSRYLLYYLIYLFFAGIAHINLFNLQSILYPFTFLDYAWFRDLYFSNYALTIGFFALFTLEFLETSEHLPRFNKVFRRFIWLYICIAPVWITSGILKMFPLFGYMSFVLFGSGLVLTCFIIAIVRILQKGRQAYYYVFAYLIYTISLCRLFFITFDQIEPPNTIIFHWLYAFSLEMVVLSIALGERFLSIRNTKERAQKKAYAEAKAFNRLEQDYTQSLHQEVDDQTAELNLANKRKDQLFKLVGNNLHAPIQEVTLLSDEITRMSSSEAHPLVRSQTKRIWITSFNLLTHLENLLSWACLKIQALPFNPAEHALTDVIDPLLVRYQSFMHENQITIAKDIDTKLSVYADLDAITMIFRNLIAYVIADKKISRHLILSAFEHNSRICVRIEHTRIGSTLNKTVKSSHEPKEHFAIQLCRQLLKLHNSELIHTVTYGNRSIFEFELERA